MLREQALGYFEELASHNHGTTNAYLKHITYGLLGYFYRIISRTKKNRAMRHAMRKPQNMTFKHFYARLTEIDNFLTHLPGSDLSKNITYEEISEIILHSVPNWRAKESYINGWYFNMKTYKETCAMFEQMELAWQVYEGGTT